ncbi:hypothetical protein J3Q64DRAFT_1719987 [Phycomyces blakesleeanus]|uniref:Uncharacterized protein n=2 Tax=Phycomyces blakesleeanus TaxID=4837 RepID=A0A167JZZ8_PHYB8|nr:hypothetical protein PHYBLDRAFT_79780 [Phycomyces blakesleeanus NRRL 1555(-)]OAD66999.1 hypothetical protein PHYBLDRAFT_79780 [Phycomyces blakesleeanus NRRL 1555(-)]|eukprot:XP_018285039.1 hypothetical protein PHYBLDRAFT_79780 [Phycomyces blakesleeanus NRRL 1555(-)]
MSILGKLGLGKKKSTKKQQQQQQQQQRRSTSNPHSHSPTSSLASISTSSSSSFLPTPQETSPVEIRAIFRTLELAWYYRTPALPGQSDDSNHSNWARFDQSNEDRIEAAYGTNPSCVLSSTAVGPCTIFFSEPLPKPPKRRPSTLIHSFSERQKAHFSSMPSLNIQALSQKKEPTDIMAAAAAVGSVLVLDKDVRRSVAPVWWFEHDSLEDGSKGMYRFDHRNQARLEALSDDRTRLVLTDTVIPRPFTVVLENSSGKSRDSPEEVRGYLYQEPAAFYTQDMFLPGVDYPFHEQKMMIHKPNSYDDYNSNSINNPNSFIRSSKSTKSSSGSGSGNGNSNDLDIEIISNNNDMDHHNVLVTAPTATPIVAEGGIWGEGLVRRFTL